MTAAISEAIRERLDRVRSEQGAGLAERLVKMGKECAAHQREPFRSVDHGELLYNDKGLPPANRSCSRGMTSRTPT